MTPSRRALLAMSAGAAVIAGTQPLLAETRRIGHADLLSAARVGDADGGALWCRDSLCDFALPARAHAGVTLPGSEVMLVGRRPGRYAAILDARQIANGAVPRLVAPLRGHRFAGHAARHAGHLVTSELHEETSEAAVTLRDPRTGVASEAWRLPGLEPHDLLFAQGGDTLVVALGGIAKPADVKGLPLNLGSIESAIVELDARSGRVRRRYALPPQLHSLSLRHMAMAPDGESIAFGMQDQDRTQLRPLAGILRLGRGIELLSLPRDDEGALRFYIGSVAIDASGRYAAATSPKGGFLAVWSLASGAYVGGLKLADVCGLAADAEAGCFWASSGFGEMVHLRAGDAGVVMQTRWKSEARFDNHLVRL